MFREKIETSSFSVASRLPPFLCKFSDTTFRTGSYPRNIRTNEHSQQIKHLQALPTEHYVTLQNIISPNNVRTEHYITRQNIISEHTIYNLVII